jgi:two-component system, OmpR family, response regulator
MTRRLLYVDDDPDIRAIVQMALELDGGFVPTLAGSGIEALAQVDGGFRPEVIVLDMMMPEMDGLETLDRLRERLPADIPVLFMTAKGRQSDIARYRERGAAGVLLKPFDPVRLGADIRGLIDHATK